ncbi:MAG: polysaccharide biosynthesis/export family protein [Thermodesulfobacteriota bacterium]
MSRRAFLLLTLALAWGPVLFACPATASDAVSGRKAFTLGPGDRLHISVWNEEALTQEVTVRPDGRISFPLIGDVQAAGREVEALRQELAGRLREYVPDAPVTVILAELGSARVYVVGKVAKPGMFPMPGELRVMQALALAGGLTPFADVSDIRILRTADGGRTAIPFDYDRVARGQNIAQDIVLEPGDTIVVP